MHISIDIIKPWNKTKLKVTKVIFLVLLVMSFYFAILTDHKIFLLVSLFFMVLTGILMNSYTNFIKVGKAVFEKNQIKILFFKTDPKIFKISQIHDVKFSLSGYKGESYILNPSSFFTKKGNENYFEFRSGNNTFRVELLLKRNQLSILNKLFKIWEKELELNVTRKQV